MPPKNRDCVGYWEKKDCNKSKNNDLLGKCPRKITTAEFIRINKQIGDGRKCPTNIFRNDYPCGIGRKCNMFLIKNPIDGKYFYVGRNSVESKWMNIDNIKKNNKFKIGSVFIAERVKYDSSHGRWVQVSSEEELGSDFNTYKLRAIYDKDGKAQSNSNYIYVWSYGSISRGGMKSTAAVLQIKKEDKKNMVSIPGLLTDKNSEWNKYYKKYPAIYFFRHLRNLPNRLLNIKYKNTVELIPYYGEDLI